jgi:hypothetical protein
LSGYERLVQKKAVPDYNAKDNRPKHWQRLYELVIRECGDDPNDPGAGMKLSNFQKGLSKHLKDKAGK